MKRYKIVVCLILTMLWSCNRDRLPEPTQNGENRIGMKVNGLNWIPYRPGFFGPGIYGKPEYVLFDSLGILTIDVDVFRFSVSTNKKVGNYNVKQTQIDLTYYDFWNDIINCQFYTRFQRGTNCLGSFKLTSVNNSLVQITKLDTNSKIISGLFWMDLYNKEDTLLKITEGRFDIKY